ncbi:hypothetical protein AB5I41_21995 [Sphingomonas sp. MMS24-JH45]
MRYWGSPLSAAAPAHARGNRRDHRRDDVALIARIDRLLHHDGYTLRASNCSPARRSSAAPPVGSPRPDRPSSNCQRFAHALAAALADDLPEDEAMTVRTMFGAMALVVAAPADARKAPSTTRKIDLSSIARPPRTEVLAILTAASPAPCATPPIARPPTASTRARAGRSGRDDAADRRCPGTIVRTNRWKGRGGAHRAARRVFGRRACDDDLHRYDQSRRAARVGQRETRPGSARSPRTRTSCPAAGSTGSPATCRKTR